MVKTDMKLTGTFLLHFYLQPSTANLKLLPGILKGSEVFVCVCVFAPHTMQKYKYMECYLGNMKIVNGSVAKPF